MSDDPPAGGEPIGTDAELAALVRRFPDARVLVLGDVMLDRYVVGSSIRLSPEAPIPVLRPAARRATLGGAANVALNIATLGGCAVLAGVVGDDAAGAEVATLLARWAASSRNWWSRPAGRPRPRPGSWPAPTSCCGWTRKPSSRSAPRPRPALLGRYAAALRGVDVVVLSDYAKGVLCDAVLRAVLARRAGVRRAGDRRSQARRLLRLSRRRRADAERARGAARHPDRRRTGRQGAERAGRAARWTRWAARPCWSRGRRRG